MSSDLSNLCETPTLAGHLFGYTILRTQDGFVWRYGEKPFRTMAECSADIENFCDMNFDDGSAIEGYRCGS